MTEDQEMGEGSDIDSSSNLYSPSNRSPSIDPSNNGRSDHSNDNLQLSSGDDESGSVDQMTETIGWQTENGPQGPFPEKIAKRKRSPPMEIDMFSDLTGSGEMINESGINTETTNSDERNGGAKRARVTLSDTRTTPPGKAEEHTKIFSLPKDRSELPVELWQYIFSYLPPDSLGRCLMVNKKFKAVLTEPVPYSGKKNAGILQIQEIPTSIWAASRRHYFPGMPKRFLDKSDIDMWKLIYGKRCQICGKLGDISTSSAIENAWEGGPGEQGVRIIWPFGIRSCGPCLQANSEKEMTLLFSSTFPSALLPALPFVQLTSLLHYVPSTIVQSSVNPPSVQMSKYYYKADVDHIKSKFEDIKALGPGAAEEWFKGLEDQGREKMSMANTWEKWEARIMPHIQNAKGLTPAGGSAPQTPHSISSSISMTVKIPNALARPSSATSQGNLGYPLLSSPALSSSSNIPGVTRPGALGLPARLSGSPQSTFPHPPPGSFPHRPEPQRTFQDVNELKAIRRAEIERRCMELDPPISPALLCHMDSFQAALQIPQPLNDKSWEILKPRLLSQLEAAQKREDDRLNEARILHARQEERRRLDAQLKETKEVMEREYEESQAPVRDRLGLYADQVIKDRWDGGASVTKDTSPKFAADVLIEVRKKFYTDVANEDAALEALGHEVQRDFSNGVSTRKLVLENMKWVFDMKIKPLTELYRKELFLCNGCETNSKFYGFEGVIQHYAAKHTNTLSLGSVVVHWRAEWPEHPPFNPNPTAAQTAFYAVPTPTTGATQGQSGFPSLPSYVSGPYVQPPQTMAGPVAPQYSPGPYGASHGPEGYLQPHHGGPFAPPQPANIYQGPNQGYGGAYDAYYTGGPNPPYQDFQGGYAQSNYPRPQSGYPGSYAGPQGAGYGPQYHAMQYPGQAYPTSQGSGSPGPYGIPGNSNHFGPYNSQGGPYGAPYHPQPGGPMGPVPSVLGIGGRPLSGIYQTQLEEMAKISRDIWFSTSGIKDLPSSVRLYVLIHHVVAKFKDKFTNDPGLAMFTDGLANHPLMKPIKNTNGLACKVCVTSGNGIGAATHSHPLPSKGEQRLYSLQNLLSHFQSMHIERAKPAIVPQSGIATPRLDWKEDMVDLPDDRVISDLLYAPGMDDDKLKLIAHIFPDKFPSPLPRIAPANNPGPVPVIKEEYMDTMQPGPDQSAASLVDNGRTSNIRSYTGGDPRQHRPIGTEPRTIGPVRPPTVSSISPRPRSASEANEDEYDPRRPAFLDTRASQRAQELDYRVLEGEPLAQETARRGRIYDDEYRPEEPGVVRESEIDRYKERVHPKLSQYQQQPDRSAIGLGSNIEGQSQRPIKAEYGYAEPISVIKRASDKQAGSSDGANDAAERFLNNFVAGDNIELYSQRMVESERQKDDRYSSRKILPSEGDGHSLVSGDELNSRNRRGDSAMAFGSAGSQRSPVQLGTSGSRNGHGWDGPPDSRPYDPESQDGRYIEVHAYAEDRIPKAVKSRYSNTNNTVYADKRRLSSENTRRPRGRFQRYEEVLARSRSRSPGSGYHRVDPPQLRTAYEDPYRARSPGAGATRQRSNASIDDSQVIYERLSPQYRYVDDRLPYGTVYGADDIEYVPRLLAPGQEPPPGSYIVREEPYSGYEQASTEIIHRPGQSYDPHVEVYSRSQPQKRYYEEDTGSNSRGGSGARYG